jgi:hypothetical protein
MRTGACIHPKEGNSGLYHSQAFRNTALFWKVIRSTAKETIKKGQIITGFNTQFYLGLVRGTFEDDSLARRMLLLATKA